MFSRLGSGRRGWTGAAAVWAAALALAGGCGPGGPKQPSTPLAGNITLDGQPIAKGTINFIPQEAKQAPAASAPIVDGRYSAKAVPLGKVLVMVRASRETGKMIAIPDSKEQYPETVEIIPAKYAQGIAVEVAPGAGTKDFELTTK